MQKLLIFASVLAWVFIYGLSLMAFLDELLEGSAEKGKEQEAMPRDMEQINHYSSWEEEIAKPRISGAEVLSLLDYGKYFERLEQTPPQNESDILETLCAEGLIKQGVGDRWDITNFGAILFANDLDQFDHSLARKEMRLTVYKGKSKASRVIKREDSTKGYAVGLENMIALIDMFMPMSEHIGKVFRTEVPFFPRVALRELAVNALVHQDFTITGTSPQIEMFEDRIEITNPGKPLVEADRMMDSPSRTRNERLATLMRRMEFCEEKGIEKAIESIEASQSAPPLFKESSGGLQVILYGSKNYAEMTTDERIRACYQHACMKQRTGKTMKNTTLKKRLGVAHAAQVSLVIKKTLNKGLIKPADSGRPRLGYIPWWGGD